MEQISEKITSLLNPKSRGGRSRQQILLYLHKIEAPTPYSIAKDVFGDWLKFYPTVQYHLNLLKRVNLIKVEAEDKSTNKVLLTSLGKEVAQRIAKEIEQSKKEKILKEIKILLGEEEIDEKIMEEGYKILTDKVIDALVRILTSKPLADLLPKPVRRFEDIDPISICVVLSLYEDEVKFETVKDKKTLKVIEQLSYLLPQDKKAKTIQLPILSLVRELGVKEELDKLVRWINKVRKRMIICKHLDYWVSSIANAVKLHGLVSEIASSQKK
ncbi:MAG: hypothetical protein QXX95_00615 [Nitrososphaerales archaeon]